MSSHLVDLHAGWTLWRWTLVRAAGFPAAGVLELAHASVAEAADRVLAAERQVAGIRARAIGELETAYSPKHPQGKLASKLLKKLKRGETPDRSEELATATPALEALQDVAPQLANHRAAYERACADATARTSTSLRTWAQDARLREAIAWQNRRALATAVDRVLDIPAAGSTNSKDRQHEYLVASYLQRYCVKNDTIGFFGPISWGDVTREPVVEVRPGRALLARRAVYFEHWAVDMIADSFANADDVKPLLAPRLPPSVAIDGDLLRFGPGRATKVPAHVVRLLTACTGTRTAGDIARELVADPAFEVDSEQDVYELLDGLVAKKLLIWALEPSALVDPERELRRQLEAMPPGETRDRLLAHLARLERARDEVAAAAGDARRIEQTLDAFDTTFVEVTGRTPSRRAGETYAARTPLYEDCDRDLSARIGAPVLDRLGPAFSLIAQSARWFTYELATRFRGQLVDCYRAIAGDPRGPIPYLRFWQDAQTLFPVKRGEPGVVADVGEELERRWASVLGIDMTAHQVDIAYDRIRDAVARTFDAPGPGWPGARHICPDVLVGASSAAALAQGELTLVLGEVHIANTLFGRFLVPHGPDDQDSLMRACEVDLPDARVLPVETREQITRADGVVWSPQYFDLELGTSKSWRPREQVLRAGDLVVSEENGSLVVSDPARGHRFDVIAFLEGYLTYLAQNYFRPTPRGDHVPRVTIEGVVLCREQWRFPASTLPFATTERGPRQLLDVRAWATSLGMPRWIFAKVPEEPKPVFVDFDSPLLVEMFAKIVRKASTLTVTEMLPTVEQCWIPDASGQTYTSELRLVAVDPRPWAKPQPSEP